MNYYILFYKTVDNYVQDRQPYRAEHLALATQHVENGSLVLGGALANPADEAILIFKGDSPDVARSFAEQDPYVKNGLIQEWSVREWTAVVGTALG